MPNAIGYQDLAAFLARQSGATEQWQQRILSSPFGTIHAAIFSFPEPTIPRPYGLTLAALDPGDAERSTTIMQRLLGSAPGTGATGSARMFPVVDRRLKGDRLPVPEAPLILPVSLPADESVAPTVAGLPKLQPMPQLEPSPGIFDEAAGMFDDADATARLANLYFGNELDPRGPRAIEPWQPHERPLVEGAPGATDENGQMIAAKGEVTGSEALPKSPAERLALDAKDRKKAEKCLADAIYFESRGEPVRGQMAVAQVVMNRVFSPFYPNNVCGVVYQNAQRRLACQFTFACDGKPETVDEPEAWTRAEKIAADTLDGKLWLPEIGKATHYHAYWVHPSWVKEMNKLTKLGVHTFYRPRAWGDGSNLPTWGDPKITAKLAKTL